MLVMGYTQIFLSMCIPIFLKNIHLLILSQGDFIEMFEQLELLIVIKWSEGEFESSVMPVKVKVFWSVIMVLLVLYPTINKPVLNKSLLLHLLLLLRLKTCDYYIFFSRHSNEKSNTSHSFSFMNYNVRLSRKLSSTRTKQEQPQKMTDPSPPETRSAHTQPHLIITHNSPIRSFPFY
ncbi:uncharacterized protein VP01_764g2 [Puccinia sorghi]|uniref:Uncharacterized protein n=1 Tax=Puccinia sorghi TaxID=27349 RepID=A0A0L6UBU0_9BASI|nr:uncharacterized protein VP01_764g2 [Puccinia sorghi]